MKAADESHDSDSRWDDVEAERRAVEEDMRAVRRDIEAVPHGTLEASELRREAGRLRDEHQRLTDEVGLGGRSVPTLLHAVAGEHNVERRRIALQILAILVPWRDALRELDSHQCDLFRVRAHALLNYLDVAVLPYPDLQDALAAARAELASERRSTGSHHFH